MKFRSNLLKAARVSVAIALAALTIGAYTASAATTYAARRMVVTSNAATEND